MKTLIGLLLGLCVTTAAAATETGINQSNFKGWQGISLWCETDAPDIDQSNYICGLFYGEFSKRAKAEGVSFAYVQTQGTHTARWLYENNWFPVSVEMNKVGPGVTTAKVVIDFLENRDIRLYENAITLKGSSFQYGKTLQNFFRDSAKQFVEDFSSR